LDILVLWASLLPGIVVASGARVNIYAGKVSVYFIKSGILRQEN